jgi:hypothetical protein
LIRYKRSKAAIGFHPDSKESRVERNRSASHEACDEELAMKSIGYAKIHTGVQMLNTRQAH